MANNKRMKPIHEQQKMYYKNRGALRGWTQHDIPVTFELPKSKYTPIGAKIVMKNGDVIRKLLGCKAKDGKHVFKLARSGKAYLRQKGVDATKIALIKIQLSGLKVQTAAEYRAEVIKSFKTVKVRLRTEEEIKKYRKENGL